MRSNQLLRACQIVRKAHKASHTGTMHHVDFYASRVGMRVDVLYSCCLRHNQTSLLIRPSNAFGKSYAASPDPDTLPLKASQVSECHNLLIHHSTCKLHKQTVARLTMLGQVALIPKQQVWITSCTLRVALPSCQQAHSAMT